VEQRIDTNLSLRSPARFRNPSSTMSPTRLVFGNAPPVMWAKGSNDQVSNSGSNKNEQYSSIRERALRNRDVSAPGEIHDDMKIMYHFWAHFLVRNFNPRMYEEFRKYAFEDAARQTNFGMNLLITYYDEVLNSKKRTIPVAFAKHYVELVKVEDSSKERPAFAKLRAAWRNGALDMKSRKKIDNFVDSQLRAELEK
jgi:la-related protein 1